MTKPELIAQYRKSDAELRGMGFEKTGSVMAGKDSAIYYAREKDGRLLHAFIAPRMNNEIRFI